MGDRDTDKAARVRGMFSGIARRYDLLNHLLSLGLDRGWRKEAAGAALARGARDVLDVATGTGDLALAIKRRAPGARVVGLDFVPEMLLLAGEKAARAGLELELHEGDALALPFTDRSFDAVTIAYGLRNLASPTDGLREFFRVLRPGGRLVVLEFPPPPGGLWGRVYRWYFTRWVPFLGGLVSGRRASYDYLPASVLEFMAPEELARALRESGFAGVEWRLQSFGASAIYKADRPAVEAAGAVEGAGGAQSEAGSAGAAAGPAAGAQESIA